jgi:hypothetical protein
MPPERILDTGCAGPNRRRGAVIRYPRLHDYFRRAIARVADQTPVPAADDPAAKLLSLVQCVLSSHARGGLSDAGG